MKPIIISHGLAYFILLSLNVSVSEVGEVKFCYDFGLRQKFGLR